MDYRRLAGVASVLLSLILTARGDFHIQQTGGVEDKRVFGSPRLHGKRAPDWIIRILESGTTQDDQYRAVAERITSRRKKADGPSIGARICAQLVFQLSDICSGWNRDGSVDRRAFGSYRLGRSRVNDILEEKLDSLKRSDTSQKNLLQTMLRGHDTHGGWLTRDEEQSEAEAILREEVKHINTNQDTKSDNFEGWEESSVFLNDKTEDLTLEDSKENSIWR